MICKYPYVKGNMAFRCGQCMSCRISKRREWTFRLLCEGLSFEQKTFLTLTYSEEHLPDVNTLDPVDYQLFMKRLRNAVAPAKIRFLAVGEYGTKESRPHFHFALFGYPNCRYGQSRYNRMDRCCDRCDLVHDTWRNGYVHLGEFNSKTAQYVAGYTTKKLTNSDSFNEMELQGRLPEFMRCSQGIGKYAADDIAETLKPYAKDLIDVPTRMHHDGKMWPLGRYMRNRMRLKLWGIEGATPQAMEKYKEEINVQAMREDFFNSKEFLPGLARFAVQEKIYQANKRQVSRVEYLNRLYAKEKSL